MSKEERQSALRKSIQAHVARKERDKHKKPKYQKTGKFSYKVLMSKSLSTLYRMRKAEEDSYGTYSWYLYPGNFKKAINYCIRQKRKELKNE